MKDRAALGIIEAAEANGWYVHLLIFSLPRDLSYSAHMACMAVLYINVLCALDRQERTKIPKT